ncbi:DCC1-like thiol-disulfide oxidoreductase family protein [Streptomyces sp. NPDC048484]|uniref:thiol-disulfide oxidoreductase DCC family protein n=1 Tax=Streptomyces sp. NPDC048484 TaxID=3155146 RepID=UPI00344A7319
MTAVTTAASPGRDATRAPVRGLTVLYDARCSLCAFLRDWLVRQRQLVPLELVAAGSAEAERRFPGLDHATTLDEITVVGDAGQLYRGTAAWVVTLWALADHRPMAHRLSTPAGARLARGAVLAAAKWREGQRARREGAWGGRAGNEGAWGGRTYVAADGWTYDQAVGWTYHPPACGGGTCAPR